VTDTDAMHRHAWANRAQSLLLVIVLVGISALAGALLLGREGLWIALGAALLALLFEPTAASRLTLGLYRASPIPPETAPGLWHLLQAIAVRAGLDTPPVPHYIASPIINAFAVGNRTRSAIALTDGLLRELSAREIAGVLAHEAAHIAHGDLRVMGLADYVSRLTSLFALAGQILLLLSLPWLLVADMAINWLGLGLLIVSPHVALLAQLGLSRVREFDADLKAAELTGDPAGLASALARIEQVGRSWRSLLLPGWGNPEPSWLRTHPVTEERIRRLLALGGRPAGVPDGWPDQAPWFEPGPDGPVRGRPRWRHGGLWW
jgi:heat shock protein HtpX